MRTLLMAAAATIVLGAATPAAAQVYLGADPGGVGAQVGPFGFGVGPRYDNWRDRRWRDRDSFAYRRECPLVRERVETPSGRVIVRTHRECY
jgi:hypothetical protein